MERKNRFLSGVYHDVYIKKPDENSGAKSKFAENPEYKGKFAENPEYKGKSAKSSECKGEHAKDPEYEGKSAESPDAKVRSAFTGGQSPVLPLQQEGSLEQELNSLMNDFYKKQGLTKHEEVNSPPFNALEIRKEIEKLIGLSNIKEDIEALTDFVKIQNLRLEHGLNENNLSLHTAFIGNPGTGKTTVARLMGEYFKALGILKKGHLVEVTRSDLVAQYVGGTAVKTNKVIDSALDGILFIDEAYALSEGGENDFGKEAISTLVDRMEKDRNRLAVFLAGYDETMKIFLDSNPGLGSRVSRRFYFNDYTGFELMRIFNQKMEKSQYEMNKECLSKMEQYFSYLYFIRDQHFGNGRIARNTLERLIRCQSDRLAEEENVTMGMLKEITLEDIEKAIPINDIVVTEDKLDKVMDELNRYVGLKNIKEHILSLINMIKTNRKREELGLPVKQLSYHAIFCGSPGTGKTTIARILGEIFQTLGILKKGHVVEVDRSGLVAGYMGQTEEKTNKVINTAMDGILFVDEAYALTAGTNDFGQNAIDTILKRMDDDRERLIVIAAGYTNKMKTFINSNPGLKDRFNWIFEFQDYTESELYDIFITFSEKQQYLLNEKAQEMIKEHFHLIHNLRNEQFGNGRYVRNLFEKIVMEQSNRIGSDIDKMKEEDLSIITEGDVSRAFLLINNI